MVTNRSITVHYITVPKRLKMRIRILDGYVMKHSCLWSITCKIFFASLSLNTFIHNPTFQKYLITLVEPFIHHIGYQSRCERPHLPTSGIIPALILRKLRSMTCTTVSLMLHRYFYIITYCNGRFQIPDEGIQITKVPFLCIEHVPTRSVHFLVQSSL